MEWLFSHPEEIQEDDELARALVMSLRKSESDAKEDASGGSGLQAKEEIVQLLPVEELLSTCARFLEAKESLASPVTDLLVLICSRNDVKEVASQNELVKVACELLEQRDSDSIGQEKQHVPKWETTTLLTIDHLLLVDCKLDSEIVELLKRADFDGVQTSISIVENNKQTNMECILGSPGKHVDLDEQKKLVQIACSCTKSQLPADTMHTLLQLCSTLTRVHCIAFCFLEADGVGSLHSLIAMANRFSNGRAAKTVCQVKMAGDRPYILLLKDCEKDKSKEKEKTSGKEKGRTDGKVSLGNMGTTSPRNRHGRAHESNFKNAKIHQTKIP